MVQLQQLRLDEETNGRALRRRGEHLEAHDIVHERIEPGTPLGPALERPPQGLHVGLGDGPRAKALHEAGAQWLGGGVEQELQPAVQNNAVCEGCRTGWA